MKLSYSDNQLNLFSKCNLLDMGESDPEYLAALSTAKWAILRIADEKPITKQTITQKFESEYLSYFPELKEKNDKYWNGIRLGRRFITKIFWLLAKYSVLQPIQSYCYLTPFGEVTGEYAIIQKRSETEKALVLNLLYSRPLNYQYPNILSSAKWIHAKDNMLDVGIYNFCMFKGDDWKQKEFNEPLIINWLHAILHQISSNSFYVTPGSYCNNCKSKRCLEGFNVR